jgi:hypothetical protein
MLAGRDPSVSLGPVPPGMGEATLERVAACAVLAGCRPEHFAVVEAAVRAMLVPGFNLHGQAVTTQPAGQIAVVNGPVRAAAGLNSRMGALGPGTRANATIGRALRLVVALTGEGMPGRLDRSTLGHPGKFTFCVAEDEEDHPWTPLASERGVPAERSAVTVLAAGSPHQLMNEWTREPRELLETYAATIRANLLTYSIWPGNYALVIGRQHRDVLVAAGWSKRDIREFVHERARVTRGEWCSVGKGAVVGRKGDNVHPALRSPDDLLVVAAGGPAGGFGAVIPPWYAAKSVAVTVPVETGDAS